MKKEIQDTDLVSARKAAIAWKEDAEGHGRNAAFWRDSYLQAKRNYPTMFIAGLMIGVLGVLIVLMYVN